MQRLPAGLVVSLVLLFAVPALTVPSATGQFIVSDPPPETIIGHVRSDVGAPLGGALLHAESQDGSAADAMSEPDGSYAIQAAIGVWQVTVTASGHDEANASVVVASMGAVQDFTLAHHGSVVRGHVRDAKAGAAVGNATVSASGPYQDCKTSPCPLGAEGGSAMPAYYRPPTSTLTRGDGSYAIGVERGGVSLQVTQDGYRDGYASVDASEDATQDFALEKVPPKNAVLQGTVTDAKTGEPIADAWVSAWPAYPPYPCRPEAPCLADSTAPSGAEGMPAPPPDGCCYEGNSTQTDAQGRFRMAMYPGNYTLSVGAPDHAQHQEPVRIGDGATVSVDVALEPIPSDSVVLRGKVTDGKTGGPVPGAWVSVENQQWGHYNSTPVDEHGNFQLRTKPGWTLVWVRADQSVVYAQAVSAGGSGSAGGGSTTTAQPGFACPEGTDCAAQPTGAEGDACAPNCTPGPAATPIRQPDQPQPGKSYYTWVRAASFADGQTVDLQVKLDPKWGAGVEIKGYVVNASAAKAIPGAYVSVRNEDTGDWGYATTDKDGSFLILGRPGRHVVEAGAEGYFRNALAIDVGDKGVRVDVKLQPGAPQGYCCVAYAEAGMAKGARAPANEGAPQSPGGTGGASAGAGAPGAVAQDLARLGAGGPATYPSAGGGLGPYDASKAPKDQAVPLNGAPGFEALAGLAAVGAAALLGARRR
jgi:hypothetical protein